MPALRFLVLVCYKREFPRKTGPSNFWGAASSGQRASNGLLF